MIKHRIILLSFFLFFNFLFSQNYIDVVQNNIVIQNNNVNLSLITSEVNAFRNSWEKKKLREEAISKAHSQLALIKNTYENSKIYPEQIIDGWHLVIATDNYNYCSPAKVFIQGNEIKQFVIGNWEKMTIPFNVLSPIKDGKALITLDFKENTDTLELYFINDLQKPTLTEKPLKSGFVSFWSDMSNAKHIKIWFENKYYGELTDKSKTAPNCGSQNTITIEVKPGTYSFKGAGRGSIAWNGTITIKENSCLSYILNKENKKM